MKKIEDLINIKEPIVPVKFIKAIGLGIRLRRIMRKWIKNYMRVTEKDLNEIKKIKLELGEIK